MNKEVYRKLQTLKTDVDNYLITSLDEESMGGKLLICGDRVEYQSENWTMSMDFWQDMEVLMEQNAISNLGRLSKTGILNLESINKRFFVEKLANKKKMYICGAGHVSLPIIRLGKMLGFHVVCIEDRPKFADMASEVGANEVICDEFDAALGSLSFDKDSYIVIVTRGHHYDESCLRHVLGKTYAYLGMMGSKRRVKMIKDRLIAAGFEADEVERIHAPIGMAIDAQTPEEIAVSIMAEIISLKNKSNKGEGFEQKLLDAILDGEEGKILATIIGRKGSAPRQVGTKMLISQTHTFGTIGGGCAEADAVQEARKMLLNEEAKPRIFTVNMTEDEAAVDGMVCGGVIDVLMEVV